MKDLIPNGKKKNSPKKKEVQKKTDPILTPLGIDPIVDTLDELDELETDSVDLESLAKNDLESYADGILGPEVDILENQPQDTDYLEEGSEAQNEAMKEAVQFDKDLIVSHDYGSSEWKLITSAINEKLDYRSLTHAMPLGAKGSKGVLIKTMVIMSGSCAVHTIVDRQLKVYPDPEAVNLNILK